MERRDAIRIGEVKVELEERRLHTRDGVRPLTPVEAKLVASLVAHRGSTLPRERLLREVWGYSSRVESRAVDHAVARLRKKIERDPTKPQWITSTRGDGYKLEHEATRLSKIPEEPASFVGRTHDLERVADALNHHAVVVLVGLGGIGKTRLAVRMANLWQDRGGEVVVVALGNAGSGAEALGRVAAALGADPERIVDALESRPGLLCVLDEVETLKDEDLSWIGGTTGPRFLLTSQRPLAVARATLEIGPLPVDEAIALLVARSPVPVEVEDGARLVEVVQRVPFALELAARWLRGATPDEVLLRIHTLRGDGAGGRHETVVAALSGSWELLSTEGRSLVGHAALFSGPFLVSDLEEISASDPTAGHVLSNVADLVARGWLYRAGPKLGVYTVVRQFLRECDGLPAGGGERLAAWLSWAPRADRSLRQDWDPEVAARLATAEPDLRRVVNQVNDPDVVMPLLVVSSRSWSNGIPLRAVLAEVERVGAQVGTHSEWAADLHLLRGMVLEPLGDLKAAQEALEAARAAVPYSRSRDDGIQGAIDVNLSSVLMDRGDIAGATALCRQAIGTLVDRGEWHRAGLVKVTLGRLVARGDIDVGIALMLDALRDLVRVGNPAEIGRVHAHIARSCSRTTWFGGSIITPARKRCFVRSEITARWRS